MLSLLSTGCSSKSPEQLINEKPIYSEENYILFNKIKTVIPSIEKTLTLPENSSDVGKINRIDIDKDLKDEFIVFEKIQKEIEKDKFINQISVTLLTEDSKENLNKISTIVEDGDLIKYANFKDLNNDKNEELILLIKSENKMKMCIYDIKDYIFEEVYSFDLNEAIDMKIEIDDVDNDSKLDIISLYQDENNKKVFLNLLEYNEKVTVKDKIEIDEIKLLEGAYLKVGKIDKNSNGIIIDYPTIDVNGYNTQICIFENKKIKKLFNEDYKKLHKPYYIEPIDINEDNVLDFPTVNQNNSRASNFSVNWYNYNGEINNSDMIFLNQIYYNYSYSFKLIVDDLLVDKTSIKEENIDGNYLIKIKYSGEDLFSIVIKNKTNVDDGDKIKVQSSNIIGENQNYSFELLVHDENEFDKLNLNIEKIKENFSYID